MCQVYDEGRRRNRSKFLEIEENPSPLPDGSSLSNSTFQQESSLLNDDANPTHTVDVDTAHQVDAWIWSRNVWKHKNVLLVWF